MRFFAEAQNDTENTTVKKFQERLEALSRQLNLFIREKRKQKR